MFLARNRFPLFCLLLGLGSAPLQARDAEVPSGFSAESGRRQLEVEEIFASVPSPASSRRHHFILTEEPHVAGTPAQRKVAEYVLGQFRRWGIPAEIVEYHAYLPYPRRLTLSLLEPEERELALTEEGIAGDKDSYAREVILPFNAYSPSAEVEGQVLYVNYGLPEDYRYLEELGIDVAGKIVLARYGKSFRGVKVRVAEQHHAAGVLLYSDPRDDGYFRGDVYPDGPMRPASGIQRGSVQYLFIHPGDPLTPEIPAHPDAQRLEAAEAKNLPSIPSQPLSYQEASRILRHLAGPNVPEGWQGGLPFAYHVGPGPVRVRLAVEMDYAVRPIWNVIARWEGSTHPDEWVVVGNHIDAWTYGGVDPSSGTTALLEMVAGFGKLIEAGIRPRRTIVFGAWDGEEYGLIGSTEWGEDLRAELMEKAVAYVNVDSAVRGSEFSAAGIPSLRPLLWEVTRAVRDPDTRRSVYETWRQRSRQDRQGLEADPEPPVEDLGSGSDYTVFVHHLGIASLDFGFTGPYGVYHSIYDNHQWMSRYGDPGWRYHPTLAEIWGRLVLRLANADLLPFDYSEYGRAIRTHLQALQRQAGAGLDWTPLLSEAETMERIGAEILTSSQSLLQGEENGARLRRINELLRKAERTFLHRDGLPGRPWFRHTVYAPGLYTGYASKPLPGLSQAIDDDQPQLALQQAAILLQKLKAVNQLLDQVRRLSR